MVQIAETLIRLRQSLNEEDADSGIIRLMCQHHKYLIEYIDMISSTHLNSLEKQKIVSIFLHILAMHAKAEGDVFYPALGQAAQVTLRHEGLKGFDEHEITFEIIEELKAMNYEKNWSEEIDAKVKILAGFIKSHIQEEEKIMYPMARDHIIQTALVRLADDYLSKCKTYLDIEIESIPSVVSRSDVMTFFY